MTVSTPGPAPAQEDAAWVTIETTWDAGDLRALLDDIERVLRINPLLEIRRFDRADAPARVRLAALDLATGREINVVFAVASRGDGVALAYESGLKSATTLTVAPRPGGSLLTIREEYAGASPEERARRLDEVDRSLVPWGEALHAYLARWQRWSRLAPWRWYMRRIWLPMRPRQRRIAWLIWVISALEFAAFLVVLGFWAML